MDSFQTWKKEWKKDEEAKKKCDLTVFYCVIFFDNIVVDLKPWQLNFGDEQGKVLSLFPLKNTLHSCMTM